jgi:serine/threonine protein kinase
MSRKMDESNYYDSKKSGKWPLKWYPPDATINGRFDEKSDVWSFGVTCWEATSYGGRPYQGIDICMVLMKLENGHRLEKPLECPDELYDIMYKCWLRDRNLRPRFKDIVKEIEYIFKKGLEN